MRLSRLAASAWVAACVCANARSVPADFDRLIVEQRYADARALAQTLVEDPAAAPAGDEARLVLLMEAPSSAGADTESWLASIEASRSKRFGAHAAALAAPAAVRADI